MTHIGEPIRRVEDIPRPVRVPRIEPSRTPVEPFVIPEREPVPVRRGVPEREPVRVGGAILERLPGTDYVVTEIPYGCFVCGRELLSEGDVLYCPEHGVVFVG